MRRKKAMERQDKAFKNGCRSEQSHNKKEKPEESEKCRTFIRYNKSITHRLVDVINFQMNGIGVYPQKCNS